MDFKTDIFKIFNNDWALLTAGTKDKFNTMTISWGGLGTLWSKPVATVYVRPNRYTYEFIENNPLFSISFYPKDYKKALALLGAKSGRDCDKIKEANLTPQFLDDIVTFKEATTTIICKKLYYQDLDISRFPQEAVEAFYGTDPVHRLYIAEVIKIIEINQ